ncbi:cell wall-binding repeat-containing protein [Guptibacillus algicola]|uniref:cell wall-binding repeat-containing protein n=1 Tax=Guptibacillus algicola TaxID=225844 RepID=UPI001CD4088A|nr:cell wall-binding repeat-containing protein [Alkalihalobacillus algicola]MCA0987093.1 cell wall-binding repeat-containing protein [Alkalihalobacillus algicola]
MLNKTIGIISALLAGSLAICPSVQATTDFTDIKEGGTVEPLTSGEYSILNENEPNNSFSQVNQTIQTTTDYMRGTLSANDKDLFKLKVSEFSDIELSIYQTNGEVSEMDLHMNVYDRNKEEIDPSIESSEISFSAVYSLAPGTYYIEATDRENLNNGKEYELHASVYEEVEPYIDRIAGENRYDTAVKIAMNERIEGKAKNVVLATGEDFPDALAGAPLAHHLQAPILLTEGDKLTKVTEKAFEVLQTERVTIVGGTGVISEEVERYIEIELNIDVERISGKNRYETAAAIAEELPASESAVVAYGKSFPDALSIAPVAAQLSMPILLTETDEVPKATSKALSNYKSTFAVGGTGVIGDDVFGELPQPERLSGSDRYETSVAIANYFGRDSQSLNLATGDSYADALTGSVLAAKFSEPMVLTPKSHLAPATAEYIKKNDKYNFTIFGGTGVVEKSVEEEIMELF